MPLLHNKSFKKTLLALSLIAGTTLLTGCGSGGSSTPEVPVNTAPVVSGEASPIAPENQTEVGTYTATDAQGDAITFSLDGADAALFAIDATGSLSFVTAPDFESGDVGPYTVQVQATDAGNLTGAFAVSVSVSDVFELANDAVVQTVDGGYTTSKVVYIDGQTQQITTDLFVKTRSDYVINTYQSDIYHIGRNELNTIDKYSAQSPDANIWSYSTKDPESDIESNAYSMVFASESKAYVLRYGANKVWIVNPQAQQEEDFYIGALELDHYTLQGNQVRTPRTSAAVISEGKLYIAMQRLDDNWNPDQAYVAVFDIATDEEIETNSNADDGLKGILLTGINPLEDSIYSANNNIYVTTRSPYFPTDVSLSKIEEINPVDYSLRTVVTATDITENETHTIKGSVVVSAVKGYFYTNAYDNGVESGTLYEFNPTTGEIVTTDVGGNGTDAIGFIALDASNILWVSAINDGTPGIDLIDTATNTKVAPRILTELNPNAIRFLD